MGLSGDLRHWEVVSRASGTLPPSPGSGWTPPQDKLSPRTSKNPNIFSSFGSLKEKAATKPQEWLESLFSQQSLLLVLVIISSFLVTDPCFLCDLESWLTFQHAQNLAPETWFDKVLAPDPSVSPWPPGLWFCLSIPQLSTLEISTPHFFSSSCFPSHTLPSYHQQIWPWDSEINGSRKEPFISCCFRQWGEKEWKERAAMLENKISFGSNM